MWRDSIFLGFFVVLAGLTVGTESAVAQSTSAEFVMLDTETQGSWKGMYGQEGYNIVLDAEAYPGYAEVVFNGHSTWTWAASTTDVRGLEKAAGGDRLATCWFSSSPWTIDINLTDGRKHQVAVYFLDWDSTDRGTTVEILDAATAAILDSQEMMDYNAGKYLVWEIKGHVVINVVHVAGANSVASGIFFDRAVNKGASRDPDPMDTALDVPRDASLRWTPGEFAATHDVYLGTSFDDVNDASRDNPMDVLLSQGQTIASYDPEGVFAFEQTYYWRIDEVNGAPDHTIFKGDVWSFTAEPLAYPIPNVTASSNIESDAGSEPENLVNGSGLNENDEHSTESADMWQVFPAAGDPVYVDFEFDDVYKLHEMLIWNYNHQFESMLGFSLKDVTVEYSEDGVDWAVLGDVTFYQGTGLPDYRANTTVAFGGVAARYVRLKANSVYGTMGKYGLSEVRFLYIPAQARAPQPADGALGVSANTTLSWRAGREAVSHEVYLSTDPNALAMIDTTDDAVVDPGALDLGTTYYWRIDEVNSAEVINKWEGAVWSFATQAYIVVDDFESYTDDIDAGEAIFLTWLDGYGIDDNGSTVGHLDAPFAEQDIVHGGAQSMPLFFENTNGVAVSEAEFALSQDWTTNGIQSLSLYFRGAAGNTGQLYVKINGTKVLYDGDATDITEAGWLPWNIDLSTVGGNLNNVTSLIIGIEGAGASGVVYIDDIRLHPQAPEYYTPVAPDDTNLVGHWTFDEGTGNVAADVSGNGNDATIVDGTWQAGPIDSALGFSGMNSYANIPAAAWSTIETQATVSVWLYVDSPVMQDSFTFAAYQDPANGNTRVMLVTILWDDTLFFDTGGDTTGYDRIYKVPVPSDYADAWIHWSFVKNADTGEQKIYRNGILWQGGTEMTRTMTGVTAFTLGANTANTGDFWTGAMDDFRLYNRELSPEELLWLAGRRTPVGKPF